MAREDMRAGDGDRQRVADKLRSALDEGRLDLHEYDERLQKTLAAKTYGDLDGLLDDLPGTVPVEHSQVAPFTPSSTPASGSSAAEAPSGDPGGRNFKQLTPYAGVVVMTVLIWAVTSIAAGHALYFWPIWVAIPLLLGIMGQLFRGDTGGGRKRNRNR